MFLANDVVEPDRSHARRERLATFKSLFGCSCKQVIAHGLLFSPAQCGRWERRSVASALTASWFELCRCVDRYQAARFTAICGAPAVRIDDAPSRRTRAFLVIPIQVLQGPSLEQDGPRRVMHLDPAMFHRRPTLRTIHLCASVPTSTRPHCVTSPYPQQARSSRAFVVILQVGAPGDRDHRDVGQRLVLVHS